MKKEGPNITITLQISLLCEKRSCESFLAHTYTHQLCYTESLFKKFDEIVLQSCCIYLHFKLNVQELNVQVEGSKNPKTNTVWRDFSFCNFTSSYIKINLQKTHNILYHKYSRTTVVCT